MSAPQPGYADPLPVQQSSWPKVIGIISIVLGCLGAAYYGLCGVGGTLVGTFAMEAMTSTMTEAQRAQMEASIEIQRQFMVPNLLRSLFAMGLGILLLVVGLAMVKRRRWSRTGALLWAGGKTVDALAAGAIAYLSGQATVEMMESDPNMQQMPQGIQGMMAAIGPISAVMTALFLIAYPVFMVIWMNRGKVVEEVRAWE